MLILSKTNRFKKKLLATKIVVEILRFQLLNKIEIFLHYKSITKMQIITDIKDYLLYY